MKFSLNIQNTNSFILNIIKHNWKIRRFWVVDPLKIDNFSVLARCKYYDLRLLESIFIRKLSLNLNNQTSACPLYILNR